MKFHLAVAAFASLLCCSCGPQRPTCDGQIEHGDFNGPGCRVSAVNCVSWENPEPFDGLSIHCDQVECSCSSGRLIDNDGFCERAGASEPESELAVSLLNEKCRSGLVAR